MSSSGGGPGFNSRSGPFWLISSVSDSTYSQPYAQLELIFTCFKKPQQLEPILIYFYAGLDFRVIKMIVSAEASRLKPVVFICPFSDSDSILISMKMHTDNPPAYSADVPPSSGGASNHFPPATVDQVHIFTNHEDIKGTLITLSFCHLPSPYLSAGTFYIDPHVPSLRRNRKRKSQQMPHASFRSRKGDISIDLGTTGDLSSAKKANIEVATDKGDVKINLVCA